MKQAPTICRCILVAALPLVLWGCSFVWDKAKLSTNVNTGATRSTELTAPSSQDQRAEDISMWKTYRNEQYGFEVKYPTDFYVTFEWHEQSATPMQLTVDLSKYKSPPAGGYFEAMRINAGRFSGDFEKYADEFIKRNIEADNDALGTHVLINDVTKNRITIDDANGYKISGLPATWSDVILFSRSEELYFIGNSIDGTLFQEILSTFRFVKST